MCMSVGKDYFCFQGFDLDCKFTRIIVAKKIETFKTHVPIFKKPQIHEFLIFLIREFVDEKIMLNYQDL